MNRFYLPGLVSALVVIPLGIAHAKVEADPNKKYELSPEAGTWVILAASYTGDDAEKKAHSLVQEIRARFDLPAYFFNRGEKERAQQEMELEKKRQEHRELLRRQGLDPNVPIRLPKMRIENQCAVVIGGFKDMDDARKGLEKVKRLDPPKSVTEDSIIHQVTVKKQDMPQSAGKDFLGDSSLKEGSYAKEIKVNPLANSFVVRNPTVPVERPPDAPDPILKKINAGESYSLLNCKKPWTLVVKDFPGAVIARNQNESSSFLEKLFGGKSGTMLDAAALQAHEVARVLRQINPDYDAYVLHMRHGSIVTVGGYDTPNDHRLLQNQKLLANLQLGPVVQLLAQPLPMQIPR